MKFTTVLIAGIMFIALKASGNNILVANVTMSGQNAGSQYTYVQFDLSWDNSWNLASGPSNWDAAWIFVKFQITGGGGCVASTTWNHATLSSTGSDHSVGNNNGVAAAITAETDGKGIFINRSVAGS